MPCNGRLALTSASFMRHAESGAGGGTTRGHGPRTVQVCVPAGRQQAGRIPAHQLPAQRQGRGARRREERCLGRTRAACDHLLLAAMNKPLLIDTFALLYPSCPPPRCQTAIIHTRRHHFFNLRRLNTALESDSMHAVCLVFHF